MYKLELPASLGITNLERITLSLTIRCEYWRNADDSSKLDS